MVLKFLDCKDPATSKRYFYSKRMMDSTYPAMSEEDLVKEFTIGDTTPVWRTVTCKPFLSYSEVSEIEFACTIQTNEGFTMNSAKQALMIASKAIEGWSLEEPLSEAGLGALPNTVANVIIDAVWSEVMGGQHPNFRRV